MKKKMIYLISSLVSFFTVSIAIIMMYFLETDQTGGIPILNLMCGLAFWIFLLVGIVLQVILSRQISKWIAQNRRAIRHTKTDIKFGIISFFKNIPGTVSDITFIISLISLLISYWFSGGTSLLCYISLSVVFLAFCAHCIFNGKNYYFIKNGSKIEESSKIIMEESK